MLEPANAQRPIEVTLLGIFIDLRFGRLANASSPIEVTLFGILTDFRFGRPSNACLPILRTPSVMITVWI
jgi:hypothetical protein